ncbi:substrate-binding periplasmic protein [Thalassospira sp. SM2505]|jgi:polar amino acid transport system substrate-binding protein|uniref:ABC transporter substrate-binding protein n=1 Tax=Thalassospira profundimaris TaxID=502049 RepID=A0A367X6U3_9PROT|nr:transporter substrate-binding domain-containing protein [Thalassospira profundimaris]RCK49384.1 ABC transporter substrate-binding protein [Thalassospira profundimaris]
MRRILVILTTALTWISGIDAAYADDQAGHYALNADGSRDCTRLIASGNPDYPPYLWKSGDGRTLDGAAADFLKRVGELAGVEIDVIQAGSWSRVQHNMQEGTLDMIAGAFLTAARLEYMDYFFPAFQGTRTVIWTLDNLDLNYRQWSDLQGLEGLTVIDNSFGQEFDAYAVENLSITKVPSLEQGLKMLTYNRGEYLIYEEFPGKAFAARQRITNIRSYDTPVSTENLYLTMSHKSACNTGALRGRINRAVLKLVTEDAMKDMLEASIQRWGESTN